MKLGFVVNDIETEREYYTTTRLAMAALGRGHEVWTLNVGDLGLSAEQQVTAVASSPPRGRYKSHATYLAELRGPRARHERITVDDLDVLMLRNDPADDAAKRPFAQTAGITFGLMAVRAGVIVVNHPEGLAKALNKMYFQHFPEDVRPRTMITRSHKDIKHFAKEMGTIVIKPMTGSGGQNVFLVRPEDIPNINQMVDAVMRDGYIVAQEYLPAAEKGDMRLIMVNGNPLRYKGHVCAFRRVRTGGDMRSNVHAGGHVARAEVTDKALELAEMVRPKLVQDGMFFVGLDIVGDKLMEINVFSPGGLGNASRFENVNFVTPVLDALQRKVDYMRYYRRNFDNKELACL